MSNDTKADLLNAILSLDSYNRGYGVGITGLNDTGPIGNYTILSLEQLGISAPTYAAWQTAGFYAIAYKNNATGEIVISYRGTNFDKASSDANNGYGLAIGDFQAPQVDLAVRFYQSVAATNPSAKISVTGHSLGGGLAGFVGSIYGLSGVLFNNMPFELAADAAYVKSLADPQTRSYLYGTGAGQPPSEAGLTAYATTGEFLSALRQLQTLSQTNLDSNGGRRSPSTLHSVALSEPIDGGGGNDQIVANDNIDLEKAA